MTLSSPSRSPTYPFSAQRLAAIAKRLPQGAERQLPKTVAERFSIVCVVIVSIYG
jgi:hypothetical protein